MPNSRNYSNDSSGYLLLFFCLVFSLILFSNFTRIAEAASLQNLSDTVSSHVKSGPSNHTFNFTSLDPVSIGETMTLTFADQFDLSGISGSDIEVVNNGVTLSAGADYSLGVAGQVITVTFANNYLGGLPWQIIIGTDVLGGTSQITNPDGVLYSSYLISIAGTFGGTGTVSIPVTDSNSVAITAYVLDPNASQSGGNTSGSVGSLWTCGGSSCLDFIITDETSEGTVLVSGYTTALAVVEIVNQGGQVLASGLSDDYGHFQLGVNASSANNGSLIINSSDSSGRTTVPRLIEFVPTVDGAVLYYDKIFLSPAIEFELVNAMLGHSPSVKVYGTSVPYARIVVTVNNQKTFTVTSDASGFFEFEYPINETGQSFLSLVAIQPNTGILSMATDLISVKLNSQGILTIENTDISQSAFCHSRGDITGDGETDISDLLYVLSHRGKIPLLNFTHRNREASCLNDDGYLDLNDLSIIGFYMNVF